MSVLRWFSPVRTGLALVLLVACVLVSMQKPTAAAEDIRIVYRILAPGTVFDPTDREGLLLKENDISLGYTNDELWIGFERSGTAIFPDERPLIVDFGPHFTKDIDIHLFDREANRLVLIASCGSRSRDRSACAATGVPGSWEIERGRIEDLFIRFAGTNALSAFLEIHSSARIPWNVAATIAAVGALSAAGLWSILLLTGGFSWLTMLFVMTVIVQTLHSAFLAGLPYLLFPAADLGGVFDANVLALTALSTAMHYVAIHALIGSGRPLRIAVTISSLFVTAVVLAYLAGHESAALLINMVHVNCLPIAFLALTLTGKVPTASRQVRTMRRLLLLYFVLFALMILPAAAMAFGFGIMPWHFAWNSALLLFFFGFVLHRKTLDGVLARERTSAELRLSVERAQTNERMARVFTMVSVGEIAANLSHEVRTPLATLMMSLKNLRASLPRYAGLHLDYGAHADVWRNLDRMERAVTRMRSVTDGVSSFIRAPVITGEYSLTQAVADSLALLDPRLRADGIALTQHGPTGEALVHADKFEIETIILNIVFNACDAVCALATRPRSIDVGVVLDGSTAAVVVTDNGGGVPEHDLDRIFAPMYTTKPDGTGLGLPMVRQMMERLNGSIRIANTGDGVRVTLAFPLVRADDGGGTGAVGDDARPVSEGSGKTRITSSGA